MSPSESFGWRMDGGRPDRVCGLNVRDFHLTAVEKDTESLGLDGSEAETIATPLAVDGMAIVPDASVGGFACYSISGNGNRSKGPHWRCGLGAVPARSATPVLFNHMAYACYSENGELQFLSLDIDNGEATYLDVLPGRCSFGQTPVRVGSPQRGGAVVWPLQSGIAAMHLPPMQEDPPAGRAPRIFTTSIRTSPDEYLLSPVSNEDSVFLLTSAGRLFQFKWAPSPLAFEYGGISFLGALEGSWVCGQPVFLGERAGIAFAAVNKSADSGVYMIRYDFALKSFSSNPRLLQAPGFPTDTLRADTRLLDIPVYVHNSVVFVPSSSGNGMYRLWPDRAGGFELSVKETDRVVHGKSYIATLDTLIVATSSELVKIVGLHKDDPAARKTEVLSLGSNADRGIGRMASCGQYVFRLMNRKLIGVRIAI